MPRAKRSKKPKFIDRSTTVGSIVADAFSDAESIKDELQSWYDNLHENFQNGSKGEALQTAIDALENTSQPDVPESIDCETVSYREPSKLKSRRDRLDLCVTMLETAAEHARNRATDLGDMKYNDDGTRDAIDAENYPDAPETEDERDSLVTDLEAFADDCGTVVDEWNGVEFPGMFG